MSHQSNINEFFKKAYEAADDVEMEELSKNDDSQGGKRKREMEEVASKGSEESADRRAEDSGSQSTQSSKKMKETEISAGNNKTDKKKSAVQFLSESESEDSEGEWEEIKEQKKASIPFKDPSKIVPTKSPAKAMKGRFSLVIKHQLPTDINKQIATTMNVLNKILENVEKEGTAVNWKGFPVLLPWQDEEVYENRAIKKFQYKDFHDKKELQVNKGISFLKEYVYRWSILPKSAREKDQGEAIKYFQIQLGWFFEEQSLILPAQALWFGLVSGSADTLNGVSVKQANTQASDPTVAIQFLQSALNISGSWDDMGHADCSRDLSSMLRNILGKEVDFGLVARKFDGGRYTDKTPTVMTVECDRRIVQSVQKDLVVAFAKTEHSDLQPESKTTKKLRIQNGIITNWVAIPPFSAVASKSDVAKLALYSQLAAQERTYRANLLSCKVIGIQENNLDQPTPSQWYLTPEVLLQMENEMISRGDTPVRHLIWDALFKETKMGMIKKEIQEELPEDQMTKKIKELKEKITWKEVIQQMQESGVKVPYSSFPIPNPSKLSLRHKLLSLKSRKFTEDNILVFESVTVTDEGELLLTFKKQVSEEAHSIAELLPLFIKHEMQVDPLFYCKPELLQVVQEGYYNPLTRSGFLGLLKNTQENYPEVSKKIGLPEFCRKLSGPELVKVLKCPGFSSLPMVADLDEDDLASLANSIATSPNPRTLPESSLVGLENLLKESKLIETPKEQDEISDMSNSSFDSKGSYNRFQIHERAQFLATKLRKTQAMQKLIEEVSNKNISAAERDIFCKIGGFTKNDFKTAFPHEVKKIWKEQSLSDMEIDEESDIEDEEEATSTEEGSLGEEEVEVEEEINSGHNETEEEQVNKLNKKAMLQGNKKKEKKTKDKKKKDKKQLVNQDDEDEDSTDTPKRGSPKKAAGGQNSGKGT